MCLCGNVQVAEQQGKYLAKQLNIEARAQKAKDKPPEWSPFKYHHLGSMALVGEAGQYASPGILRNTETRVPGLMLLVTCSAYLSLHTWPCAAHRISSVMCTFTGVCL